MKQISCQFSREGGNQFSMRAMAPECFASVRCLCLLRSIYIEGLKLSANNEIIRIL